MVIKRNLIITESQKNIQRLTQIDPNQMLDSCTCLPIGFRAPSLSQNSNFTILLDALNRYTQLLPYPFWWLWYYTTSWLGSLSRSFLNHTKSSTLKRNHGIANPIIYFLCGNNGMAHESRPLLTFDFMWCVQATTHLKLYFHRLTPTLVFNIDDNSRMLLSHYNHIWSIYNHIWFMFFFFF